jgi:hypothetical protein
VNPDGIPRKRSRRKRESTVPRALEVQPGHIARRLMHGRQSACRVFLRDDGRWDVEGRLVDVKTHDIQLDCDLPVAAGEPYRTLALSVTLDECLSIRSARVETGSTLAAARARAAAAGRALVGRSIDSASCAATRGLFDMAAGCMHLSDLLGMLIATVRETIPPVGP